MLWNEKVIALVDSINCLQIKNIVLDFRTGLVALLGRVVYKINMEKM
jgi:hypothetical protein